MTLRYTPNTIDGCGLGVFIYYNNVLTQARVKDIHSRLKTFSHSVRTLSWPVYIMGFSTPWGSYLPSVLCHSTRVFSDMSLVVLLLSMEMCMPCMHHQKINMYNNIIIAVHQNPLYVKSSFVHVLRAVIYKFCYQ